MHKSIFFIPSPAQANAFAPSPHGRGWFDPGLDPGENRVRGKTKKAGRSPARLFLQLKGNRYLLLIVVSNAIGTRPSMTFDV